MSFLARGALNSKKRFGGGVLEPTHLVEFYYEESRSEGGLCILREARLMDEFSHLRKSYESLELALFALDCVGRVSLEGDQNSRVIFQLLGHLFDSLREAHDLEVLKLQFVVKFMFQQGVLRPTGWMVPFVKTSLYDSLQLSSSPMDWRQEASLLLKASEHYIRSGQFDFTN